LDVQKIRDDFPILHKEINGKKIVYLDSACMSLKPDQVINKIIEYYHEFPSCGGRSVHKLATKVTIAVDEARLKLQRFINAKEPNEIIFLRNATEGMNLVANCIDFQNGSRVLITDREHNSNLVPWVLLHNQNKVKLDIVHSNPDNTFNLETFENMMDKNVKLISMVHTSNLDGYTIPAEEVIKIAHDYGARVMLDAAQSAPHKVIDVQKMDVDFLVFSIHKMCGPTGTGVLYGKYSLLDELCPYIVGGSTVKSSTYSNIEFLPPPEKFEAGLQNYAGIIGAGAAAQYLGDIGLEDIAAHELKLNKIMTDKLSKIEQINTIGPKDHKERGCIFSFNIKGMVSHDVAKILDEVGNIMIRSGMQCVHSWYNDRNLKGSARASVYLYNTEEEVNFFSEKVIEIVESFT